MALLFMFSGILYSLYWFCMELSEHKFTSRYKLSLELITNFQKNGLELQKEFLSP
jgi:hypothetical protein